jgi:phosphatidylglycerophosphatase A
MAKLKKQHQRADAIARLDIHNPLHVLAVGLGSGLAPKAPGTFGTLAAVVLYLVLGMGYWNLTFYAWAMVVAFGLGVWFCHAAAKAIGVPDHGSIVWDEFVGFWITMFAAPTGFGWVVAGFCLFRLFDIIKPWPIRWLDQYVKGGFGIMIDDVIAGIFSCIILQVFAWIL